MRVTHRAIPYGQVCNNGCPSSTKYRVGSAMLSAGLMLMRHGPCADLLVFHARSRLMPRFRSPPAPLLPEVAAELAHHPRAQFPQVGPSRPGSRLSSRTGRSPVRLLLHLARGLAPHKLRAMPGTHVSGEAAASRRLHRFVGGHGFASESGSVSVSVSGSLCFVRNSSVSSCSACPRCPCFVSIQRGLVLLVFLRGHPKRLSADRTVLQINCDGLHVFSRWV